MAHPPRTDPHLHSCLHLYPHPHTPSSSLTLNLTLTLILTLRGFICGTGGRRFQTFKPMLIPQPLYYINLCTYKIKFEFEYRVKNEIRILNVLMAKMYKNKFAGTGIPEM